MSDNARNNETTGGKSPSHVAYHVRDRESGKSFWTRIGVAFEHADGQGFTIQLDGLAPLDGRVMLRVPSDKKE